MGLTEGRSTPAVNAVVQGRPVAVGGVLHNLTLDVNSSLFILVECGKYVNLGQDAKEKVGTQLILYYRNTQVPKLCL